MVKDFHLSEDLVNETFLHAMYHIHWFEMQTESYQRNYLKRISRNLCVDHMRRKERFKFLSYDDDFWSNLTPETDHTLEFVEKDAVETYINLLDGVERDTMRLKYYDDYSIREISAMEQVPENTIVKRLSRGRQKLRTLLEERPY